MPVTKTDVRSNQDLVRKLQPSSSAEVILVGKADMNALISAVTFVGTYLQHCNLWEDADGDLHRQQDAFQLAHALMTHVVAEIIWEGSQSDAHCNECLEKTIQQFIVLVISSMVRLRRLLSYSKQSSFDKIDSPTYSRS